MEDSSSRNYKRSDGGFDEDAWDSSTAASSFSKKLKRTDEDDTMEFAELKLSSPLSKNLDEIRLRYCSSAEEKAAAPATSTSESSSAPGRLLVDGDFCSAAADFRTSGGCCFSNVESSELDVKEIEFGPADLEAKSYETENSSTCIDNKFREASPSSRFSVDSSGEKDMADSSAKAETTTMEKPKAITSAIQSVPPPATLRATSEAAAKESPSQEEIDEFFTTAENEQQKRFAEKYNFDVVKDVPLEGRYQWVRLKP